jgi:hypothetical protein
MKTAPYLKSVRCALPDRHRPLLDQALAGDALAARRLMIVALPRSHGHIACLAYQLKTPNPAYREILQAAWIPESRHLIIDFWPTPMIRRMFARADFSIPVFAGSVRVFRSVCGGSVRKAAAGLCWTLSLKQATRHKGHHPTKILQATADPSDLIYWGNRRGEQEIISRQPPNDIAVLSTPPALVGCRAGRRL